MPPHNHPGQTLAPSREDILFTKKLEKVCDMIGLVMVDSLIIA